MVESNSITSGRGQQLCEGEEELCEGEEQLENHPARNANINVTLKQCTRDNQKLLGSILQVILQSQKQQVILSNISTRNPVNLDDRRYNTMKLARIPSLTN